MFHLVAVERNRRAIKSPEEIFIKKHICLIYNKYFFRTFTIFLVKDRTKIFKRTLFLLITLEYKFYLISKITRLFRLFFTGRTCLVDYALAVNIKSTIFYLIVNPYLLEKIFKLLFISSAQVLRIASAIRLIALESQIRAKAS